jgi:toxoflavin synthase
MTDLPPKKQYDTFAPTYTTYSEIPTALLEAELIRRALGDLTGLKVLDLGGGSGSHARRAVDAGAALVDVVDISEAMLQEGRDISARAGREDGNRIRWFAADASKPLIDQGIPLEAQYDVAMANWVFDHALSVDDLRGMWANLAAYTKPGGRFVGVRVLGKANGAAYLNEAKYGVSFADMEEIPGGRSCTVVIATDPPFKFGCTIMADSSDMINDVPRQAGFTDFELVPDDDTDIVKANRDFWEDHLAAPLFGVVMARRI